MLELRQHLQDITNGLVENVGNQSIPSFCVSHFEFQSLVNVLAQSTRVIDSGCAYFFIQITFDFGFLHEKVTRRTKFTVDFA